MARDRSTARVVASTEVAGDTVVDTAVGVVAAAMVAGEVDTVASKAGRSRVTEVTAEEVTDRAAVTAGGEEATGREVTVVGEVATVGTVVEAVVVVATTREETAGPRVTATVDSRVTATATTNRVATAVDTVDRTRATHLVATARPATVKLSRPPPRRGSRLRRPQPVTHNRGRRRSRVTVDSRQGTARDTANSRAMAPPAHRRLLATEHRTVDRKLPGVAATEPRELPLQVTEPRTRVVTARTGVELRPKDARTGATGLTKMFLHLAWRVFLLDEAVFTACLALTVSSNRCDLFRFRKLMA